MRLVQLPLDVAAGSVGQLAGRLSWALPRRRTGLEEAPPPLVTAAGNPVLLVHGLSDGECVVSSLQRGLDGVGAGPYFEVGCSAFTPDIRAAAQNLGERVERACESHGTRSIVVIGYSLGGLIARYYVQRLGGDARVPLLITLATPHGGTATALLAPPHPLLRQLRPGSALLTELAELPRNAAPGSWPSTAIWTRSSSPQPEAVSITPTSWHAMSSCPASVI